MRGTGNEPRVLLFCSPLVRSALLLLPLVCAREVGAAMNRTFPPSAKTPAAKRAFLIYYARVLLREAKARRGGHRAFPFSLLEWAGRARRDAAALAHTECLCFDAEWPENG